jgi:RimJ/RimL family protein N-acetyltransferase
MTLGTWNVRSLWRSGSVTVAARELARYILDFLGVRYVNWDKEGTVGAEECNVFY